MGTHNANAFVDSSIHGDQSQSTMSRSSSSASCCGCASWVLLAAGPLRSSTLERNLDALRLALGKSSPGMVRRASNCFGQHEQACALTHLTSSRLLCRWILV